LELKTNSDNGCVFALTLPRRLFAEAELAGADPADAPK
jgi:hypothetical protein